jgi:hypothetical protein
LVDPDKLEIRVLSPAFFSRLVHYAHTTEAFDRESIFTDEKNRTIFISRPELLSKLFFADDEIKAKAYQANGLDRYRWKIHQRLRCPPATPAYLFSQPHAKLTDIRLLTSSPLDRFVQQSCADTWLYRRQCVRLFLAQRFFFGFTELVDLSDVLLRLALIIVASRVMLEGKATGLEPVSQSEAWNIRVPLLISAVNIWEGVKGAS